MNKKIGTKTIHVNRLLRLSMYSERFGVTDPDAPQGLERRMMHLTARRTVPPIRGRSTSIPFGMPLAILVADGPGDHKHSAPGRSLRRFPVRSDSDFRSHTANSLDICSGGFHYSVIDGRAAALPASVNVGCRPLNDEVPASKSKVEAAGTGRQICCPGFLLGGFFPVRRRKELYPADGDAEVMDDASTQLHRLQL